MNQFDPFGPAPRSWIDRYLGEPDSSIPRFSTEQSGPVIACCGVKDRTAVDLNQIKIVQRAVVTLLNAIYEEDFLGMSYGFRPGRGTHDALDALCVGIHSKK